MEGGVMERGGYKAFVVQYLCSERRDGVEREGRREGHERLEKG